MALYFWLITPTAAPSAHAASVFLGVDSPRVLSLPNSRHAQAEFLATLASFGTETLDSIPDFTPNPSLTFAPIGVTAETNNTMVWRGLSPVSWFNVLRDDTGDEVFTFSSPMTGFGAFFIGLGTQALSNQLSFVLENTSLATSKSVVVGTFGTRTRPNNVAYLAVIDAGTPFNRLTVKASNEADGFEFDDVTVGFAVPESANLATCAGLYLAGLAFRRGRSTRHVRHCPANA